jgi:hypothetical protein
MLTVTDDDLGIIPIYDFPKSEMDFICSLLRERLIRPNNPTVEEQVTGLLDKFTRSPDCEIEWSDVFLISSLLLNKAVNTDSSTIKIQVDRVLAAFESATSRILESTGNSVEINEINKSQG